MKPWWHQDNYGEWFDYELACLEYLHGITVDDVAKQDDGHAIIRLTYMHAGEAIPMMVDYSPQYPYFPPSISTPGRRMYRHRGGTTEEICFLGHNASGDYDWVPFEDTVARMLTEQVPVALTISDAVRDGTYEPEQIAGQEVAAGEPLVSYLSDYLPGGLLMNDYEVPSQLVRGDFTWVPYGKIPSDVKREMLRGVITKVRNNKRANLQRTTTGQLPRQKNVEAIRSNWIRVSFPHDISRERLWEWMAQTHPDDIRQLQDKAMKNRIAILGLIFEDEIRPNESGTSWVFLGMHIHGHTQHRLILPALRTSHEELNQRVPELYPMREKKVLQIGLGSIGAPVAIQLAKAGVGHVRVVDRDYLTPGNIVRWPLGMGVVGHHKAQLLADYLTHGYPEVKATGEHMSVGDKGNSLDRVKMLYRWIREADMVIDATASYEANRYLATVCHELGKPFIWLSTTEGAWGGIVGRFMHQPNSGCFYEYARRLHEEEIATPHLDHAGTIMPAGCITSTFTGNGVDCEQMGLFGARFAISTMCENKHEAYPPFDWDVGVCNFRDAAGKQAIAPEWSTYSLSCPDDCRYRNSRCNE